MASDAAPLDVHLVTPTREVWAGEATLVIARSVNGDLGVMAGHVPTLAELGDGPVTIRSSTGDLEAQVEGGFLSVGRKEDGTTRVDLLAESVTGV